MVICTLCIKTMESFLDQCSIYFCIQFYSIQKKELDKFFRIGYEKAEKVRIAKQNELIAKEKERVAKEKARIAREKAEQEKNKKNC